MSVQGLAGPTAPGAAAPGPAAPAPGDPGSPGGPAARDAARRVLSIAVPVGTVAAAIASLRLFGLDEIGAVHNVLLIFAGLLIEALPFVLLGAIVSAAIEVFMPERAFRRFAAAPASVQVCGAAFGGLLFPVCECGSVPVARRLVLRGLSPKAAVTFMLAAPIVNPVVILSTIFAYQGRDILLLMVAGRVLLGLGVAVTGGLAAGGLAQRRGVLGGEDHHGHDHGDGCGHDHGGAQERSKAGRFLEHMAFDFGFMARFMMIGALIAAIIQTAVPQDAIEHVAGAAILAIGAMMLLAFALALCSESDAILISSFVQFSPAAQLAFLVFGPMVDTKLVALYSGTFGVRFTRVLVPVVALATFVGCLWVEAVYRIW